MTNHAIDFKRLETIIPSSRTNLKRLQYLQEDADDTRIAVFGKYNHGKSTLLNTIIGRTIFKTSDKRETVENSEYKADGLVWIDTPGLDADMRGDDDKRAKESALQVADFLFLVHNVKTGELDKYETSLYQNLIRQDKNHRAKMFLILTQIDQVSESNLQQVQEKIRQQMPDLEIYPVSAIRYQKGTKAGKEVFKALSQMAPLFTLITTLNTRIIKLREKEVKRLKRKIKQELREEFRSMKKELTSREYQLKTRRVAFQADVRKYLLDVRQAAA